MLCCTTFVLCIPMFFEWIAMSTNQFGVEAFGFTRVLEWFH